MSTVLIDTSGGSSFSDGKTQLAAGLEVKDNVLDALGISLTDTDKKPILKPSSKVIDVVNNFSWYAGPKATSAALNKVPCVFLTEREQLLSSLISGGLYYLNATARAVDVTSNNFIKSLLGEANESLEKKDKEETLVDKVTSAVRGAGDGIRTAAKIIDDVAGGSTTDRELLKHHNLNSLRGIYFTKPTDFHYRLPMYDTPTGGGSSAGFGSDNAGQVGEILSTGVNFLTTAVEDIAKAVNFAQPGVFIEKPQYFQGVNGRAETVSFPLSNTIKRGNVSPIQQNYELLWLLTFQNTPYKTSFTRTPPPKIYTVSVPGQFSMPYAFIEKMSVDFVGTVRKTSVLVPSGNGEGLIGSKVIQTPVPEAYQVSITFKSLLGDYGNSMISDAFSVALDGNGNKVKFGK